MLFGKLYAMLIFGVEGSKGRTLSFAWRQLMNIFIVLWVLFTGGSVVQLIEKPSVLNVLLAVAILAIMPVFIILIRKWGKKKIEDENSQQ